MVSNRIENNGDLFSRQGLTIVELAKRLIKLHPGDKILSVVEHAQELEVSVGTLQSALNYLRDQKAIELDPRGRLGTFISALDYSRLWILAYNRPLVGALPLPDFAWSSGLASGIRVLCNDQTIDVELRYIRGATKRLEALTSNKCDWTIVSKFMMEHAQLQGFEIEPVVSFGPKSYTVDMVILFSEADANQIEDGMRVGIDSNSFDHTYMVHSICRNKKVEYVDIDFSETIKLLQQGEIDATCWQSTDVPEGIFGTGVIPFQKQNKDTNIQKISEAIAVTLPNQTHIQALLQTILQVNAIQHIQSQVVNGLIEPLY